MTAKRRAVIDHTGLRKRPQMEQIVNYLENGQERVKYPDREAKFIRNHPYMTQLDFFDMQEEQQRAWEEQKRQQEAKEIATQAGTSEAFEGAKKSTRNRKDTGLPRPDDMSRGEAQRHFSEDFGNKLAHPDVWEEHDAEAKTMQTDRKNRSESIAQTVSFSLREQARHPDSDVRRQEGILQKLKQNVIAGYKFMVPEAMSPRSQAKADEDWARMKEGEAWYKQQRDEDKQRTLVEFMHDQAKEEQDDGTEAMLAYLEAENEEHPSSSSSSASAVRFGAKPHHRKKRSSSSDDVEITGTGGANRTRNMKFWFDSSAREIRTQFAVRGLDKTNYALKDKAQLLNLIQAKIREGTW